MRDLAPVPPITFTEAMMRQAGQSRSAITILAVAGTLIWFGLSPRDHDPGQRERRTTTQFQAETNALLSARQHDGDRGSVRRRGPPNLIQDVSSSTQNTPQKRLEQIIQLDEKQAAAIQNNGSDKRKRYERRASRTSDRRFRLDRSRQKHAAASFRSTICITPACSRNISRFCRRQSSNRRFNRSRRCSQSRSSCRRMMATSAVEPKAMRVHSPSSNGALSRRSSTLAAQAAEERQRPAQRDGGCSLGDIA